MKCEVCGYKMNFIKSFVVPLMGTDGTLVSKYHCNRCNHSESTYKTIESKKDSMEFLDEFVTRKFEESKK